MLFTRLETPLLQCYRMKYVPRMRRRKLERAGLKRVVHPWQLVMRDYFTLVNQWLQIESTVKLISIALLATEVVPDLSASLGLYTLPTQYGLPWRTVFLLCLNLALPQNFLYVPRRYYCPFVWKLDWADVATVCRKYSWSRSLRGGEAIVLVFVSFALVASAWVLIVC